MEGGQAVLSNGSETALCCFSPSVLKEVGESFGKVQFYVRDNSVTEPVSVFGTISCHYLLIAQKHNYQCVSIVSNLERT